MRRPSGSCWQAEVDLAIRVLMQAGSYNESLRRRYEAGLSVKGLGNTDLLIKTPLASWPAHYTLKPRPGILLAQQPHAKCQPAASTKSPKTMLFSAQFQTWQESVLP